MNDPYSFKLIGSFRLNPESGEFVGCVAKQEGHELTLLTVGCEATEMAILDWIRDTIMLMRTTGHLDVQAADMHDRAAVNLTQH
jgi:hypothetical protein